MEVVQSWLDSLNRQSRSAPFRFAGCKCQHPRSPGNVGSESVVNVAVAHALWDSRIVPFVPQSRERKR